MKTKNFHRHASSKKADSKIYRYTHHELGEDVDAYFDPRGCLELSVVLDGRRVRMAFDANQSAFLAKRLIVDTGDRALQLMAAAAREGDRDVQERCQLGTKKMKDNGNNSAELTITISIVEASRLADKMAEDKALDEAEKAS